MRILQFLFNSITRDSRQGSLAAVALRTIPPLSRIIQTTLYIPDRKESNIWADHRPVAKEWRPYSRSIQTRASKVPSLSTFISSVCREPRKSEVQTRTKLWIRHDDPSQRMITPARSRSHPLPCHNSLYQLAFARWKNDRVAIRVYNLPEQTSISSFCYRNKLQWTREPTPPPQVHLYIYSSCHSGFFSIILDIVTSATIRSSSRRILR